MADSYAPYSPYNYVLGNPILNIDPDGRSTETTIVGANDDGTYQVIDVVLDGKKDVVLEDGTKVGESLTTHSFVDENNNAVVGATIDPNSSEGQDFIDNEIIGDNPPVLVYAVDAYKVGRPLDFKSRGLDNPQNNPLLLVHASRGSMTSNGKMASARDFGNMAAGIVAGRARVSLNNARAAFDWLQGEQEPPVSQQAQDIGHSIGEKLPSPPSNRKGSIF